MATVYSTDQELRAARTARSEAARRRQHGTTLLELQKSNEELQRSNEELRVRQDEQDQYIEYILQCNMTMAHEMKIQGAENRYNKQSFMTLFWCSAVFSVLVLICVVTALYFPAGIYPFVLAALLLCLLYIGILALMMEML